MPGLRSATTARSATLRLPQPECCHEPAAKYALQPFPEDAHGLSLQPRAESSCRCSVVPPTAITCDEEAGNSTARSSPALATIGKPGWSKCASIATKSLDSRTP